MFGFTYRLLSPSSGKNGGFAGNRKGSELIFYVGYDISSMQPFSSLLRRFGRFQPAH
jgi:hypothetical protein